MNAVLDSGALIAVDRDVRTVVAMLRALQRDGVPVATSAAAVAQVWRDGRRQANLARLLAGVEVVALDEGTSKPIGVLLRTSGTSDVVDAHVSLLARAGDQVMTSDDEDIRALLRALRVKADVVHV